MTVRVSIAMGMLSFGLLGAMPAAAQTNLVQDPGFQQSSTFAPYWTPSPNDPGNTSVFTDGLGHNNTSNYASFDNDPVVGLESISQSVNTTPGQYTFSFYMKNDGGNTNEFVAKFGTNTVLDAHNIVGSSIVPYTLYSYTVTATGPTTITFSGDDDGNGIFLDDVSVVASAAPEPASWALMILGFGLAGTVLRRRGKPVRWTSLAAA